MAKVFVLDTTSTVIQATASSPSSQVDYVVAWADSSATGFAEGKTDGQLTTITATTICAAPAASTRRVVKSISLFNRSTASDVVLLTLFDGTNTRYLYRISLLPGQYWASDDAVSTATPAVSTTTSFRNALINGEFLVSQRSKLSPPSYTSSTILTNANGNYTHDRWFVLCDKTNASYLVNVNRQNSAANIPPGATFSTSLNPAINNTTTAKFGFAQIVESNTTASLAGRQVTLSFQARVNDLTRMNNLKAAIISFNGTTADVHARTAIITAWNLAGTSPTLNTATGYAMTAQSSFLVKTTWDQYTVTATLPAAASLKNVMVLVWIDNTNLQTADTLYIGDLQLEIGAAPTAFERLPSSTVLNLCYRYFYSVWGNSSTVYTEGTWIADVGLTAAQNQSCLSFFRAPAPLRAAPTVTLSAANTFRLSNIGAYAISTVVGSGADRTGTRIKVWRTTGTTTAPSGSALLQDFGLGTSWILLSSEI